jgi:hypothetical protein
MEIKKSKIEELNLQADKFNDMFIFTISFENGDIGKLYKKKEKIFEKVGDEVEYTLSPKGTVKIIFKGDTQFSQKSPSYSNTKTDVNTEIRFSVAFKGAIELAAGGKIGIDEVEKFTVMYDEFLKDKTSVEMPF